MDPVQATSLGTTGGDLSMLGLFLQADLVVKLVMLLLLAASVWVWAIVFEKLTSLRRANREAAAFEDQKLGGGLRRRQRAVAERADLADLAMCNLTNPIGPGNMST